MVEFIDNLSQVLVSIICCFLSGVFYYKSRNQIYFFLSCFYGCFSFGGFYWMMYTLMITDAPPMFYVSDIAWISGYLFINLMQHAIAEKDERNYKTRAAIAGVVIQILMMIYFISIGDFLYNAVVGVILCIILWHSICSIAYYRKHTGSKKIYFHIVTLAFVIIENCLWVSSYPWVGDTLSNPYFWIDFTLTISFFCFLPAVRKAVEL